MSLERSWEGGRTSRLEAWLQQVQFAGLTRMRSSVYAPLFLEPIREYGILIDTGWFMQEGQP
jgi:hypothetical protein